VSYKQCFLAVPAVDSRHAGPALAEMARELRSENGYRGVYLATSSDAQAAATGLRMMNLLADPAPRGRVPREFFTERWSGPGPLFVAVYDDQNGYFMWQHVDARGRTGGMIATDGHRVCAKDLELTVDYPQKPFTTAQLDAAFTRDPATLSPAEARALMEPMDAITIGLAQFGYRNARRGHFLDVLNATTGWSLLAAVPRIEAIPPTAGPVISFTFEPYELTYMGFPSRSY
jgi:hypothetical protein